MSHIRVPRWTGSHRTVGDTTYRLFDDGSHRHNPAKIRGKSARRIDKKWRQIGAL